MAVQTELNGIDVGRLGATIQAIGGDPALVRGKTSVSSLATPGRACSVYVTFP